MKVYDTSKSDRVRRILERVNSSNADFVKRLLDEKRKYIVNEDGSFSTHGLAYRDDGKGNAVVYPTVQSVGTGLHAFPDDMAYDRAVYRGDTLQMSTPDAKAFTEGYKEMYPMYFQPDLLPSGTGEVAYDVPAPEVRGLVPFMYEPSREEVISEEPEVNLFSDEAKARRRLKQAYAESGFRKNAQSKAGAKGLFQIMDITHKDYLGRGKGKKGDIWDEEYNGGIRDWVMGIIPRDLKEFWSEDDSDRNKLAKLYAAYNWGAGNLRRYLRKKRDAGVDISNPDNWVEGLNPETKRYVKYLAFDEDIEDSPYTNEKFEESARKNGYMASGGPIRIKPENRGKFNALLKRTGNSASWFKAHGTPLQKKRATFALNARKWHHGDGGPINTFDLGGPYGVISLGGDYLEYFQTTPELRGGMLDPSVVTASLPAKFNGSQQAARNYAEGYLKGAKPMSEHLNQVGQDIYEGIDSAAQWVPGPVGSLTWAGHLGADLFNRNYDSLAGQAIMAGVMGGAGRVAGKYIPKVIRRSPWLSEHAGKVGDFLDDITWNDARRAEAADLYARNLDARQAYPIFSPMDPSFDAAFGSAPDTELTFPWINPNDLTRDSIDSRLIDTYVAATDPKLQEKLLRERRKKWGKDIEDKLTWDTPLTSEQRRKLDEGLIDWDDDDTFLLGELPMFSAKPGVTNKEINRLRHSSNAPYKGVSDLPSSFDITPLTDKFVEAQKARDAAFDILHTAAEKGKLSKMQQDIVQEDLFDTMFPPIDQVTTAVTGKNINKPVLFFWNAPMKDSGASTFIKGGTNPSILGIGMEEVAKYGVEPLYYAKDYAQNFDMSLPFLVGHETGHIHPGFNNARIGTNTVKPHPTMDSPYYGQNYGGVSARSRAALAWDPIRNPNLHDSEGNELFSDTHGFRTLLSVSGINDGVSGIPYSRRDIVKYRRQNPTPYVTRFEYMHPTIDGMVNALNNGWAEGGQMSRVKKILDKYSSDRIIDAVLRLREKNKN